MAPSRNQRRSSKASEAGIASGKVRKTKQEQRLDAEKHALFAPIRNAFAVVFFLAHDNLALKIGRSVRWLASVIGFPIRLMTHRSLKRLIKFAADYYRTEIVSSLNDENGSDVSILLDETTDCTENQDMIVVVRYLKDNVPVEKFLDNVVLNKGRTAEAMAKTLIDRLVELGVNIDLLKRKLIGLGTDGASSMMGRLNGIGQQLIRAGFANIVQVHCFAHRIDLVSKDVFNKEAPEEVREIIQLCRDIAKTIKKSSERQRLFRETCSKMNSAENKVPDDEAILEGDDYDADDDADSVHEVVVSHGRSVPIIKTTRWLSHYERTMQACINLRWPIVRFFETHAEYDDCNIASRMRSRRFYMMLLGVMDIVMLMAKLSREFQRSDLTIVEACKCIKETRVQLDTRCTGRISLQTYLGTQTFDMACRNRKLFFSDVSKTADKLAVVAKMMMRNISERFPENENLVRVGHHVYDVSKDDLSLDTVRKLVKQFKLKARVTAKSKVDVLMQIKQALPVLDPVVKYGHKLIRDNDGVRFQVVEELAVMLKSRSTVTFANKNEMLDEFRTKFKVFPPSTAECERGFSKVKLIKSPARHLLESPVLSNLLMIRINGESYEEGPPVAELAAKWISRLSAIMSANRARRTTKSPAKPVLVTYDDGDDDDDNAKQSDNNASDDESFSSRLK